MRQRPARAIFRSMQRNSPLADTTPEAFAIYAKLISEMSPAERVRRAGGLTHTVNMFALAGIRMRHPKSTERELLLRLAVLRLGADLVERVYGWRAPADDA
jgi:hypothetical protein